MRLKTKPKHTVRCDQKNEAGLTRFINYQPSCNNTSAPEAFVKISYEKVVGGGSHFQKLPTRTTSTGAAGPQKMKFEV